MAIISIVSVLPTNNDFTGNVNAAPTIQGSLTNHLTKAGWKLNGQITVIPFPEHWQVMLSVFGSNSDNLTTVAKSFDKTLSKYNIRTQNTNAVFALKDTTTVDSSTATKVLTNNQDKTGTKTPVINNPEKGILDQISAYFGNVGTGVIMLAGVAVVIILIKDSSKR